ncbi:nuclear transport factor 2 family protein [Streptomyces phaeochromogenes]|uniref:Nuclear transport factor 2 family protein n=1 Tax=Streptomyces phaeochromogenes TaxID=1923 RepID=A0ABZ1H762_STRPH|nr:nuclear transport factor 2 family protein [Streptomyces phaeochromogenes]WSD14340.1 nuclear transport factor 2 family protein [Streptomyces phaeochromogenes]
MSAKSVEDRLEVLAVAAKYFASVDARDWTTHRSFYMDKVVTQFDVQADTADLDTIQGKEVDADQAVEATKHTIGNISVTQHTMTNAYVEGEGDELTLRFYEEALHHHPSLGSAPEVNTWTMYGRVVQVYRRTPNGWKLREARITPVHDVGNRDLLTAAAAGK